MKGYEVQMELSAVDAAHDQTLGKLYDSLLEYYVAPTGYLGGEEGALTRFRKGLELARRTAEAAKKIIQEEQS